MKRRKIEKGLCFLLSMLLIGSLTACGTVAGEVENEEAMVADQAFIEPSAVEVLIEDEAVPLAGAPALVAAMP